MDNMEQKLGEILNNPQMMQQIMTLAQSMNQNTPAQDKPKQSNPKQNNPMGVDTNTLRRLSELAKNANLDRDQQSLLTALSPYLSKNKISKLERAMHAARMAGAASSFLNSGGLHFLTGR